MLGATVLTRKIICTSEARKPILRGRFGVEEHFIIYKLSVSFAIKLIRAYIPNFTCLKYAARGSSSTS